MAVTVLLCETLTEGRALPERKSMRVMSVHQTAAFEGLRVQAVYATAAARKHRHYQRAIRSLDRSRRKTKLSAGIEQVI